jgi:hypothetical protein
VSAEPYTAEESKADVIAWMGATREQLSEAFWELRSIVAADAMAGDEYCANKLRALAAERDGAKSQAREAGGVS